MFNNIASEDLKIGLNSFIHPTASIRGINGNCNKVEIGDNCYIGEQVQIICDEFVLGDYCKIQHHTNIHGYKPCIIGHNAWIGQYSIIDCIGGVEIGNNCGIGAHSQLWSHIKYGDQLEGCNFLSEKKLEVGSDVWFVGHCIISPIKAADKSMAMVGSVVTKDMAFNEIYAGSPAKSISSKIGFQFKDVSINDKVQNLKKHLTISGVNENDICIVEDISEFKDDGKSYFAVKSREYLKLQTTSEINFMKYLLPEKAKFTPIKHN